MAVAFQPAMGFMRGDCHLRTIIIDESFSQLDEKRSPRILDYLTSKLGTGGYLCHGYEQNVSKVASQAFLKLLEEEEGADA